MAVIQKTVQFTTSSSIIKTSVKHDSNLAQDNKCIEFTVKSHLSGAPCSGKLTFLTENCNKPGYYPIEKDQ